MSIFDKIGKALGDTFGGIYHTITGTPTSAEKRKQNALIEGQIKAYKEQTKLAQDQVNAAREAKAAEQRRIDEKQIRSLRSHYRPASGFLNQGGKAPGSQLSPATPDQVSNKLGV